jgi:hypothetical protein
MQSSRNGRYAEFYKLNGRVNYIEAVILSEYALKENHPVYPDALDELRSADPAVRILFIMEKPEIEEKPGLELFQSARYRLLRRTYLHRIGRAVAQDKDSAFSLKHTRYPYLSP